jgi:ribosomal-protein-alanine N-acetyltransferase
VGVEKGSARVPEKVRRFRVMDGEAVLAIAAESPEAANWSKESYLKLAEGNESLALVMESAGEITGFLVGRQVGDQAEVFNLAVKYAYRRKGHGARLLEEALREFAAKGALNAFLEVRESNARAIAFYEKHGFTKTGHRKGYYQNPDEAAVTMEVKLAARTKFPQVPS